MAQIGSISTTRTTMPSWRRLWADVDTLLKQALEALE